MYGTGGVNIQNDMKSLQYTYVQKASDDVRNLTKMITSLKPQKRYYKHVNGTQEQLVCIEGTVPMYYRARRYNIPVKIYLTKAHPVQAPMCYVAPTATMMVKPKHKHVAQKDGRVYLPYLAKWNFQSSNLYDLVNVMSTVFGQDPPVFKKPNVGTQSMPTNPPNRMSNTVMGNTSFGNTTGTRMSNTMYGYHPTPNYNQYGSSGQYNVHPGTQYGSQYGNTQPMGGSFGNQYGNQPMGGSLGDQYGNQQPQYGYGNQQFGNKPKQTKEQKLAAKKEELTRKVKEKLQLFLKSAEKNMEEAVKDQMQLEHRQKQQEMKGQQLDVEIKRLDNEIIEKEKFIEKAIQSIESHQGKEIDVDQLVQVRDVLKKQYIEQNAENLAIEDIFYYLDKAVLVETITVDEWVKLTRNLSTQQFENRALMLKITQKGRF